MGDIKVGDRVREPGSDVTWKVIGIKEGGVLQLSGPGPCRGIMHCDPPDVERVPTPTPEAA